MVCSGIAVQVNLGHSWHNSRVEKPPLVILLGNSFHTIQILLVLQDHFEVHFVIK